MVDIQRLGLVLVFLLLLIDSTFEQQTESLSSPTERAALLGLRSSLGLRGKDWPIKADPCSLWNGVSCRNGSVVGINISGFKRTRVGKQNPRFSVDSLLNLTNLVSFNASKFSLPGSIPVVFGQSLITLQVLDLSSCSVSGVVPVSLGNLTNLRILDLSYNSISGSIPASLGQMLNLTILDLSKNSLNGLVSPELFLLRNLSSIDLSSNSLAGSIPAGISNFLNLQRLNFSRNYLSSSIPPQLGDLEGLVDLDLSFNSLTGSVPPEIGGLRNLERMMIGDNNFTGDLPAVLWSLSRLRVMDISSNNFTGILPNSSLNTRVANSELNISSNSFYGGLTPILTQFSVIDLTGNYFEGNVPIYVLNNASFSINCLRNVTKQRTLSECASFYTSIGLIFDNFGQPNATEAPPIKKSSLGSSHKAIVILAAVAGGIGIILLFILLPVLLSRCIHRNSNTTQKEIGGAVPGGKIPPPPVAASVDFSNLGDSFTLQQLVLATSEFSIENLIKRGHSGDFFRGIIESGIPVVIKKVDLELNEQEAYVSELDVFSKVESSRLVPFLGHCLGNENHKFLVYKYMPNGDLSNSLYRKSTSEEDSLKSLDWITRLKIAIGVAEGLSYLHHECSPPLVHRDIQASSVLLDDKFEVRLGSLTEVCVEEGTTHQKRITRLLQLPQSSDQASSGSTTATCPYDVYCFGKVLLELVTGKLGISASTDARLKEYLEEILPYVSIYDKELLVKIIDPTLIVDEDLLEEVWAMAVVAKSCLNPKPSRRPLMRYILKALENPLKVVREESHGSGRLRTNSSRRSWNASIFGSWRQSSIDVTVGPSTVAAGTKGEGVSGLKRSGTNGSQGSIINEREREHSSSRRRQSKEIFPEPIDVPQDVV